VAGKPFGLEVRRRRQRQDMRVLRLEQMWQAGLETRKVPRIIDLMHQIEALHVSFEDAGQGNGAGIVDADIEATEFSTVALTAAIT